MGNIEIDYQSFSKKDLQQVLDLVPQEELKTALTFKKILDSRKKDPKRLWEDHYKDSFSSYPAHKKEYLLDAVDIVARAFVYGDVPESNNRELAKLVGLSGIFDRSHVDPEIEKIYNHPGNWRTSKSYQDRIVGTYIGDRSIEKLVVEHSSFRREDLDNLLRLMVGKGHLKYGNRIMSFELAGSGETVKNR